MKVLRYDASGALARPRKLRGGRLRVDGHFTRPGVFPYVDDATGKTVMEYRPDEEVFAPASLESWKGVAVTVGHPTDLVTDESWSRLAVGQMGDDVRVDSDKLAASIVVQRRDAVQAVSSGRIPELSGGYWCDLDETPGETADGVRYDRVQRAIEGNHVALLPRNEARLGRDMAMRLDSRGHQIAADGDLRGAIQLPLLQETPMKLRFDGKGYDLSDEKDMARYEDAVSASEKARADAEQRAVKLVAERDELKARIDAAEKRQTEREAELPKLIEQGVAQGVQARVDRLALESRARDVLGAEARADGTDADLRGAIRAGMEAAVKTVDPDAVFEGASDEYVRGRYDTIRQTKREDSPRSGHDPSLESVRAAVVQAQRAGAGPRVSFGDAFRGAQSAVQDAK